MGTARGQEGQRLHGEISADFTDQDQKQSKTKRTEAPSEAERIAAKTAAAARRPAAKGRRLRMSRRAPGPSPRPSPSPSPSRTRARTRESNSAAVFENVGESNKLKKLHLLCLRPAPAPAAIQPLAHVKPGPLRSVTCATGIDQSALEGIYQPRGRQVYEVALSTSCRPVGR